MFESADRILRKVAAFGLKALGAEETAEPLVLAHRDKRLLELDLEGMVVAGSGGERKNAQRLALFLAFCGEYVELSKIEARSEKLNNVFWASVCGALMLVFVSVIFTIFALAVVALAVFGLSLFVLLPYNEFVIGGKRASVSQALGNSFDRLYELQP